MTVKENLHTKLFRFGFNIFPAYRRTGGNVTFIASDWKRVDVSLRLRLATRNYVGSVFGGSIYGALDPIYMIQLIKILGKNYVVWDKSAEIKFIKPIKKKVYAVFIISDEIISEIKSRVSESKEISYSVDIQFKDKEQRVYAIVKKELYIADKEFYKNKLNSKKAKTILPEM